MSRSLDFVYDDGGRENAGRKGKTGDCVTRSIAVATGRPYQEVYDALFDGARDLATNGRCRVAKRARQKGCSPRDGVNRKVYEKYLKSIGWKWVPKMHIGSGCKVHLNADELPKTGRYILRLSHHLTALVDGVLHDTYDPQRYTLVCENGVQRIADRCCYGWFERSAD